jgi:hypothetical protein
MFNASSQLHLGSLDETRRVLGEAFSRTRQEEEQQDDKRELSMNLQARVTDQLAKNWLYGVLKCALSPRSKSSTLLDILTTLF